MMLARCHLFERSLGVTGDLLEAMSAGGIEEDADGLCHGRRFAISRRASERAAMDPTFARALLDEVPKQPGRNSLALLALRAKQIGLASGLFRGAPERQLNGRVSSYYIGMMLLSSPTIMEAC